MTQETLIKIAEDAITTILFISGPLLLLALGVGLVVSIFQATTQIQEQTLAFVPKIVAVLVGIVFFGPWMITTMLDFARNIFENLTRYVG